MREWGRSLLPFLTLDAVSPQTAICENTPRAGYSSGGESGSGVSQQGSTQLPIIPPLRKSSNVLPRKPQPPAKYLRLIVLRLQAISEGIQHLGFREEPECIAFREMGGPFGTPDQLVALEERGSLS